jgi:hypothetical protein
MVRSASPAGAVERVTYSTASKHSNCGGHLEWEESWLSQLPPPRYRGQILNREFLMILLMEE